MCLQLPPLRWQLYEDIVSICPSETVGGVVAGTIRFDTTLEAFNANGGVDSFIEAAATSLQISKQQVRVTDVRDGSVIVDFEVVASGGDTTTRILTGIVGQLAAAIDSGDFNVYGRVTEKIVNAVPQYESNPNCPNGKYLAADGTCVESCGLLWSAAEYNGLKLCVKTSDNGERGSDCGEYEEGLSADVDYCFTETNEEEEEEVDDENEEI